MRIKFRPIYTKCAYCKSDATTEYFKSTFFVSKRLGLCDECARKLLIVSFPEETAIIKGLK